MYFNLPRPARELWTPNNDLVTMGRDLLLKRCDRVDYGQETSRKVSILAQLVNTISKMSQMWKPSSVSVRARATAKSDQ